MSYCAARTCPECAGESRVYYSSEQADGTILRYRKCRACGLRFATREKFFRLIHVEGQDQNSVIE